MWRLLKANAIGSPVILNQIKEVDLSNNPMFSRSWIKFCLLKRFLQIINNIEHLDLSYCGLTEEAKVSQIMKVVRNKNTIK